MYSVSNVFWFPRGALIVINKCIKARHSGMDCRNPGYKDVFKLAIYGTGYPLPGEYDELPASLCITKSAARGNEGKIYLRGKKLL